MPLRVLHTSLVAPSPHLHDDLAVPLTYLDAMWLPTPPVERLFFYRLFGAPAHDDTDVIVSNLTQSLSRTLRAFFPLAARLRPTPATPTRFELHYHPQGPHGVPFTVAECDVDDMMATHDDGPRVVELAKIAPLVPQLPEGGAVLAVQATLLSARRSLALGLTVHHAACDGTASTYFLHTWAAACAGAEASSSLHPPVIDRAIIRDRKDLHDMFTTPRPAPPDDATRSSSNNFFKDWPDPGQLLATFTLSKQHLQCIKDTVAREAERRGVPPPRCTSTVATFAFVWHCHCRAKAPKRAQPPAGDRRTFFYFPVDHRPRLDPPVPENYLGNCVGPCFASAPKEEVAAAGAEGLLAACAAVAAGIDEAVRGDSGYWEGKWWMERIMEAFSADEQPLSVAGSPRFRVYDVDFGFGRPAKVDVVSVAKTGAISVAESRGGSGGMEVGVSLPPDAMDRFQSCFADAIASLSVSPPSSSG